MNSIGFNKAKKSTRVVVAMSGGVDSSVAAALLAEEGYDVIGITMQLYDHGSAVTKSKSCCAGQDIYDARRVAEKISIPHYVVDYERDFRSNVMDEFAASYMRGETPIPCIFCNQTVKFTDLLETAKMLGADAMATGHYVRRVIDENGTGLYRSEDLGRDQSYFLFSTTRDQLDFLRFPLGHFSKSEIRRIANDAELEVARKPDSQDICFVPKGDYAKIVKQLRPDANVPGHIVHVDGRLLGDHQGIVHFTVGQRKGLRIGGEVKPLYVVSIDPESHTVYVGPSKALKRQIFQLQNINWLGPGEWTPDSVVSAEVQLRNTHTAVPAMIYAQGGSQNALVTLEKPAGAVSPGQACVFYDRDRVLGGGWVCRTSEHEILPHNLRRTTAPAAEHAL